MNNMNKAGRRMLLWAALGIFYWGTACRADESINIDNAWVREAPPHAESSAAYLTIHNPSAEERILLGVTSPQFQKAEIHLTQMADGQMHMLRQDKLAISPHGSLEFKPGGYHLMLIHPLRALKQGDEVELRFRFGDAPPVTVRAPIRESAEDVSSPDHHDMMMK